MFGIKRLENREEKWSDFEAEAMPLTPDLYRIAMWLTRNREEAEESRAENVLSGAKIFSPLRNGNELPRLADNHPVSSELETPSKNGKNEAGG